MFGDIFFLKLFSPDAFDRFYFFAVVLTVVVSIVLHELGHGWMALRLGDPTPRLQGRMVGNPLVHMGPFSLLMLAVVGIAWGQMPIDPTRLRGKYAEAKVAAAGPAVNLILAFIALTALGLWFRFDGSVSWNAIFAFDDPTPTVKGALLLFVFGLTNLLLMVFNLLPVPPLDGSHIFANFHAGYARAIGDPGLSGVWMLAFIFAFMTAQVILRPIAAAGQFYVDLLAGY